MGERTLSVESDIREQGENHFGCFASYYAYHKLTNNSWVLINRRVPFKRRVQVNIFKNNRRFQISAGSNFFFFKLEEEDVTTDIAHFSSSPFSHIVLLSVSISLMIAMAPVQQKNKKYDLKFKLSVLKGVIIAISLVKSCILVLDLC